MVIQKIDSDIEKMGIARTIPDWFGIPEATEAYIADSKGRPFFCAFADDVPVGFLYLKETGRHTVELAVMGVRQEYHRQGIGRALFERICEEAQGHIDVSSGIFRLKIYYLTYNQKYMLAAFFWRNKLLDFIAEKYHSYLVIVLY